MRILIVLTAALAWALTPLSPQAAPYFDGTPHYFDDNAKALSETLLTAHGGMEPWRQAKSFQFRFFTHMINGPMPFYSQETIDLESGAAYMDWLLFNGQTVYDGEKVWSTNWPMPLSPGFFVRLTASFVTLPWQIHADNARIERLEAESLPGEEGEFEVLRITFEQRSPSIPGTYYKLFVDSHSGLMRGIEFDINHPGMVSNPNQPLGPNLHVFGEYRRIQGLIIPTFYKTFGQGSAQGGKSDAYHFAWDIRTDVPFDESRLTPPADADMDTTSNDWWQQ